MEENNRRKLLTAIGIFSILAFWKAAPIRRKPRVIDCAPPDQSTTVKMLSQDGSLVEVDISKIRLLQQKISNEELQEWVKKPTS